MESERRRSPEEFDTSLRSRTPEEVARAKWLGDLFRRSMRVSQHREARLSFLIGSLYASADLTEAEERRIDEVIWQVS